MGKSNRIRQNRANAAPLTTPKSQKKKQGMPSWALNLITILVAAVILFSVAFSLLNANGVFGRMQTAVKSDNFRVDANMMKYFVQAQYSSFVSTYSSYLSSMGLDTGVSLKEQTVSTGEDEQTWYEYFMDMAESQVTQMLVYCEEAEARGISLDDAAKESIDAEIQVIETYAANYGYTTNAYIAQIYGKGVKEKDLRNCLKLQELAELCSANISEEILANVSEDDIKAEYEENKQDYDLVDMLSYTFSVKYTDAEGEFDEGAEASAIITRYEDLISAAKEKAQLLAASADADAFKSAMADDIISGAYDDEHDTAEKDTDLAPSANDMPSVDEQKLIKDAVIAQLKPLVLAGEDIKEDDLKAEIAKDNKIADIELKDAYVTFIKEVAYKTYSSAVSAVEGANEEKTAYSDSDEGIKWAFDDARKVGDTNTFETGDKEIADDAAADDLSSYSIEVIYITKAEYRDEALTKDVAIMVFSSKDTAAEALAKLSAGMTPESFEAVADGLGGNHTAYENYTKGSLGVDSFDTWLYKEDTVKGSYTTEVQTVNNGESNTTYMLALYYDDGDAEWHVSVKSSIGNARYSENYETLQSTYAVVANEKTLARISA